MSAIIDKLQATHTGMRSIMTGRQLPVVSAWDVKPSAAFCPPFAEEYIMRVELCTLFRCNAAQYDDAYRQAKQMVAIELYKDVHLSIERIRCIAYAFDGAQALLEELDNLVESISE